MYMKKLFFTSLIITLFISCNTAKNVSVIKQLTPTTEQVNIVGIGQTIASNAILLGSINITDTGFTTKCTYADVIADAIKQAQSMGGNTILIKKHTEPNIWSTCHRLQCEVYSIK